MVQVEEALQTILAHTPVLEAVEASLVNPNLRDSQLSGDDAEAMGLILAENVHAESDLPQEPRSAVDGFAVVASDKAGERHVLPEITAGKPAAIRVEPGTVAPIMTGGVLPPGADAVVMVEDVEQRDGIVVIPPGTRAGQHVHPVGADMVRGQPVLAAGTRIGPAEIGLLATLGQVRVKAHRVPRVSVLATGDELVDPWEPLGPGQVHDSNRYALMAAAREAGARTVWQGKALDDEAEQERLIREALDHGDVVLTSGGVSMGTRDLIKPILARLGTVHFGRVNFKPGKPLTFATAGEKLIFGLPGYPVSSLVTFEVFVRPALLKMQGRRDVFRPRVDVELEHEVKPDASRAEYQRAVIRWEEGRFLAKTTGSQSSSRLLSMSGANGLLLIAPGTERLGAGSRVPALLLATV
jgi:molybdopterin molybdotransferase